MDKFVNDISSFKGSNGLPYFDQFTLKYLVDRVNVLKEWYGGNPGWVGQDFLFDKVGNPDNVARSNTFQASLAANLPLRSQANIAHTTLGLAKTFGELPDQNWFGGRVVQGFQTGGMVYAAGGGQMVNFQPRGTDTVPAMLTPGEFVINKQAAQSNLPLLQEINSGKAYSRGGVVYAQFGGEIDQNVGVGTDEQMMRDQEMKAGYEAKIRAENRANKIAIITEAMQKYPQLILDLSDSVRPVTTFDMMSNSFKTTTKFDEAIARVRSQDTVLADELFDHRVKVPGIVSSLHEELDNYKRISGFDGKYGTWDDTEFLDDISMSLAGLGLIPAVGNIFDLASIPIDLLRGDTTSAGLSALSLIEGVGQVAGATKMANLASTAGMAGIFATRAANRGINQEGASNLFDLINKVKAQGNLKPGSRRLDILDTLQTALSGKTSSVKATEAYEKAIKELSIMMQGHPDSKAIDYLIQQLNNAAYPAKGGKGAGIGKYLFNKTTLTGAAIVAAIAYYASLDKKNVDQAARNQAPQEEIEASIPDVSGKQVTAQEMDDVRKGVATPEVKEKVEEWKEKTASPADKEAAEKLAAIQKIIDRNAPRIGPVKQTTLEKAYPEDLSQRLRVYEQTERDLKDDPGLSYRARGGMIYANNGMMIPYSPRGTDTVPAMLTPGEFVVNAKSTAQNLPLLKSINNGGVTGLSKGGVVYLNEGGISHKPINPLTGNRTAKTDNDLDKKYRINSGIYDYLTLETKMPDWLTSLNNLSFDDNSMRFFSDASFSNTLRMIKEANDLRSLQSLSYDFVKGFKYRDYNNDSRLSGFDFTSHLSKTDGILGLIDPDVGGDFRPLTKWFSTIGRLKSKSSAAKVIQNLTPDLENIRDILSDRKPAKLIQSSRIQGINNLIKARSLFSGPDTPVRKTGDMTRIDNSPVYKNRTRTPENSRGRGFDVARPGQFNLGVSLGRSLTLMNPANDNAIPGSGPNKKQTPTEQKETADRARMANPVSRGIDLWDTDKDGNISLSEWSQFNPEQPELQRFFGSSLADVLMGVYSVSLKRLGLRDPKAREKFTDPRIFFKNVDKNNSGLIEPEEFSDMVRQPLNFLDLKTDTEAKELGDKLGTQRDPRGAQKLAYEKIDKEQLTSVKSLFKQDFTELYPASFKKSRKYLEERIIVPQINELQQTSEPEPTQIRQALADLASNKANRDWGLFAKAEEELGAVRIQIKQDPSLFPGLVNKAYTDNLTPPQTKLYVPDINYEKTLNESGVDRDIFETIWKDYKLFSKFDNPPDSDKDYWTPAYSLNNKQEMAEDNERTTAAAALRQKAQNKRDAKNELTKNTLTEQLLVKDKYFETDVYNKLWRGKYKDYYDMPDPILARHVDMYNTLIPSGEGETGRLSKPTAKQEEELKVDLHNISNPMKKKPKPMSSGGMVYASNGMLIPYQPRGTDTVPAMLTPGEFVVNRSATQANLPLLQSINQSKGGVVYAADGGLPTKPDGSADTTFDARKAQRTQYLQRQIEKQEEKEFIYKLGILYNDTTDKQDVIQALKKQTQPYSYPLNIDYYLRQFSTDNEFGLRLKRYPRISEAGKSILAKKEQPKANPFDMGQQPAATPQSLSRGGVVYAQDGLDPSKQRMPTLLDLPQDFRKPPEPYKPDVKTKPGLAGASIGADSRSVAERTAAEQAYSFQNEAQNIPTIFGSRKETRNERGLRLADSLHPDMTPGLTSDFYPNLAAGMGVLRDAGSGLMAGGGGRGAPTNNSGVYRAGQGFGGNKPQVRPSTQGLRTKLPEPRPYIPSATEQAAVFRQRRPGIQAPSLSDKPKGGLLGGIFHYFKQKQESQFELFHGGPEGLSGKQIRAGDKYQVGGSPGAYATLNEKTAIGYAGERGSGSSRYKVTFPGRPEDYVDMGTKIRDLPRIHLQALKEISKRTNIKINESMKLATFMHLAYQSLKEQQDKSGLTTPAEQILHRNRASLHAGQIQTDLFQSFVKKGIPGFKTTPENFTLLSPQKGSEFYDEKIIIPSNGRPRGSSPLAPPPPPPPPPQRGPTPLPKLPVNKQSGGIVYANNGMLIPYQPKGTDTVPAMLTPGEFVVNREATQQNLGLLQAINKGQDITNHLSDGGIVNPIYRPRGGQVGTSYREILAEREANYNKQQADRRQAYRDQRGLNQAGLSRLATFIVNQINTNPNLFEELNNDAIKEDLSADTIAQNYIQEFQKIADPAQRYNTAKGRYVQQANRFSYLKTIIQNTKGALTQLKDKDKNYKIPQKGNITLGTILDTQFQTASQEASIMDQVWQKIGNAFPEFKNQGPTQSQQFVPPAAMMNKGGVVYASNGMLVNYQPQGSDTVPAMLTPGEFVVNRNAAQKHLGLLQGINNGYYSGGGRVKYLADGTPGTDVLQQNIAQLSSVLQLGAESINAALTGLSTTLNGIRENLSGGNTDNRVSGVSNNTTNNPIAAINALGTKLDQFIERLQTALPPVINVKLTQDQPINVTINGANVLQNLLSGPIGGIIQNAIQSAFDARSRTSEGSSS